MIARAFVISPSRKATAGSRNRDVRSRVSLRDYHGDAANPLLLSVCQKFGQTPPTFSPLVLYGPADTGKTLLAQILGNRWDHLHPRAPAVLWNGGEFVRAYADAVDTNSITEFQQKLRQSPCLILDGLEALASRPAAQQELLAACDALDNRQAQLVVTSRSAPFELTGLMPGLIGRLAAGLVVPLAPPGAAARHALLKDLADRLGCSLPAPVARQLNQRLDELEASQHWTVPRLEQILTRLDKLVQRDPAASADAIVNDCLEIPGTTSTVTLAAITVAVAKHFGLTSTELKSASRRQLIVRARGVAILLGRQLTSHSLDQLGNHFGGRDHTTALHACRKTEELLAIDPMLQQAIEQLTAILREQRASPAKSPKKNVVTSTAGTRTRNKTAGSRKTTTARRRGAKHV